MNIYNDPNGKLVIDGSNTIMFTKNTYGITFDPNGVSVRLANLYVVGGHQTRLKLFRWWNWALYLWKFA